METRNKLAGIVAENLGIEESAVKDDSTFDDLGADSLDMVEIVMTVEDELEIEIADEGLEEIKTFGEFVEKVQSLQV